MTGQATRELSEADFQRRVIDLAKLHGWRVCHFRAAKTQRGAWVTPISGHVGAPDLLLARAGVVLLAELKSAAGHLRPGQQEWLDALGVHGQLWRPEDWPAVVDTLSRPCSPVLGSPGGRDDTEEHDETRTE